ncbi:MAG: NAD(P)/FAD-dependent oxidoreductase [Clostridiales bacterium]|nr:NAD(P)/FAD-dependent oxidoreductase [Clostridiales bacterium]
MKNKYDIIIIGAGPAGIFTAIELVKNNENYDILIIDKGKALSKRNCPSRITGKCAGCEPCAITFGWSGAGAFSDGKLSLSPEVGGNILEYMSEDKAKEMIEYADSIYLRFGAKSEIYGLNCKAIEDIKYESSKHNIKLIPCPVRHLGTEKAYLVLQGMYDYLVNQNRVEFSELTTAVDIITKDGKVQGVTLKQNGEEEKTVKADYVIAAPGRGGAEWLSEQTTKQNIKTNNNAVDIGVRVEVPNSIMDHLTKDLYEAKLVYFSDTFDNKVRTFCMNPGGVVSQENYEGGLALVNGHSYADKELKSDNTNFALLVSTRFTEPFKDPIKYGKYVARLANMLTGGGILVQRLGDLLQGRRTDKDRLNKSSTIPTLNNAIPGDLSYVLPHRYLISIIESIKAFDKIAPGLNSKNTLLYGVECKFYSSKVAVNDKFETLIENLYTIGDGAGITRGLMQSSVTGIIVARDILSKK